MADMLNDGNIKLVYAPSIANIAAPTTTELNAGTALECFVTADGLDVTVDEDVISIPKLCETFSAEAPGRAKYSISLTAVRKDVPAQDTAWNLLVRNTAGFLVFRYNTTVATAWATSQLVQVFPGKCGERRPMKPEMNGATKFTSKWYVSSQPTLAGVVA